MLPGVQRAGLSFCIFSDEADAMLFAVVFTDQPDQGALRATHLQAHMDWLELHQSQVRVAGSLREEPGHVPKGGLWIVEAESKGHVHQLMQTDPFWTSGLRQSVQVLYWSKAFDQQVLV
jgi:uncharacterized protein YciI